MLNISTKKQAVEIVLINRYKQLNKSLFRGIKNAKGNTPQEVLNWLNTYMNIEFNKTRAMNKKFGELLQQDVRKLQREYDIKPKKTDVTEVESFTYIELNSNLAHAQEETMRTMREIIKPYKKKPENIGKIKEELLKDFVEKQGVGVTYTNGRRVRADKYVEMVTRSARAETHNNAAINTAVKLGTDYVYLPPRNTSCVVCATLSGRIYNISGKDNKYPKVYGDLFKSKYNIIHPNCKCSIRPFFFEHVQKAELKEIENSTDRPMDKDNRSNKGREQYQKSQDYNRQRWAEQMEFENMKHVMGQLPTEINTFEEYRRAKEKDTQRYKDIRAKYNAKKSEI